ncbi:phosphoenolpyruvate carboxykinase (ATP) [Paenibacillus sp. LMG 31460]|uniref:Phosphoenolpyruvate carboxykinase (ATP) n=1 Tax=Paenibacillus germinis TaxID=2654979 RepID=A0ABX1ZF54_9BACL|nr:phosphoenolpyruvate carboxykinase (ATP) [Paenibacillus germinis]
MSSNVFSSIPFWSCEPVTLFGARSFIKSFNRSWFSSVDCVNRFLYWAYLVSVFCIPGKGGHPNVIIFLTADAFGVLPPISKLTKEQAMYHFLSGYTSKLAGTERGVTEPEATFSTCFGAPFLPLHPTVYAGLLGNKIEEHQVNVYLVNTGWSGGPYGVGKRMNLTFTRAMVTAALNGSIEQATFTADPIFGVLCPDFVEGVPSKVLVPRHTWKDQAAYEKAAWELAERFTRNFEKFSNIDKEISTAGPAVCLNNYENLD